MSNLFNAWRAYWSGLSSREQNLLRLMSLVVLAYLLYALIWSPIQSAKQKALSQLQAQQSTWQWLNQQVPTWQQKTTSPAATNAAISNQNQLMVQLQSSLRVLNLQGQLQNLSLTQKGAKASFDSVDADRLFKWIAQNEAKGIVLFKMSATPIATGVVRANVEWVVAP